MSQEEHLPGAKDLLESLKEALIEDRFAGILFFDVDDFHQINQTKGDDTGDRIIALIIDFLSEERWKAYRTGGDEFGLIFENEVEVAEMENIRTALALLIRQRLGLEVTISAGAIRTPGQDYRFGPATAPLLYSTVRQLLFESKKQGRNRLVWLPENAEGSRDLIEITLGFYKELANINNALARKMEIESRTDILTGLYNRRGFEDAILRSVESSTRNNSPLALIYMDSDTLKEINDSRGHDSGDRFIVDIAEVLRHAVRGSDFISRWAGDEFAVIMDHTTREKAMALAERIRQAVANGTQGTISIGVYCGVPSSVQEVVRQADQALYKAKEGGKNKTELAE